MASGVNCQEPTDIGLRASAEYPRGTMTVIKRHHEIRWLYHLMHCDLLPDCEPESDSESGYLNLIESSASGSCLALGMFKISGHLTSRGRS